jgi:hypothetical protein
MLIAAAEGNPEPTAMVARRPAAAEPVRGLYDFRVAAASLSWVSVPVVANLVAFTPVRGHPLSTV